MDRPFVVRFAVVSGLAALAGVLVRDGVVSARSGRIIAGAAIGVVALAGIVMLARIVVVAERAKQEMRR